MTHQKLLPQFLAKVDSKGRPRWSHLITCAVWILLTYINLSGGGVTVFTWLTSLTSASFFINWMIMASTSWQFHRSLKAQNDGLFTKVYAWKSFKWPLAPTWLMTCCLVLLACCFTAGLKPLGGDGLSAENFFQYIIGILVIVSFTLAYKFIYRTKLRNPATARSQIRSTYIKNRRDQATRRLLQTACIETLPNLRAVMVGAHVCTSGHRAFERRHFEKPNAPHHDSQLPTRQYHRYLSSSPVHQYDHILGIYDGYGFNTLRSDASLHRNRPKVLSAF